MKHKRGHLYHRICYLKYKKPSRQVEKRVITSAEGIGDAESDNEIDELQYLLFFKTCLVHRDVEILKIKLKQSIGMRERLIERKGTEFHKTFPFYFVEPTLVGFFQPIYSN